MNLNQGISLKIPKLKLENFDLKLKELLCTTAIRLLFNLFS